MVTIILVGACVCTIIYLVFRDTPRPRNASPPPEVKEEDEPVPFFAGVVMLGLLLYHSIFSVGKDDKKEDEHES